MKLTAKITEVITAAEYTDNRQRVKLKVAEADSCFRSLVVANEDDFKLDDEVVLLALKGNQPDHLFTALDYLDGEGSLPSSLASLRDQLRPDPPVPFLADDAVDTQEFAREVQQ